MAKPPGSNATQQCSRCDVPFQCGFELDSCWCSHLAPLEPKQINVAAECLCPTCLRAAIDLQKRTRTAKIER